MRLAVCVLGTEILAIELNHPTDDDPGPVLAGSSLTTELGPDTLDEAATCGFTR